MRPSPYGVHGTAATRRPRRRRSCPRALPSPRIRQSLVLPTRRSGLPISSSRSGIPIHPRSPAWSPSTSWMVALVQGATLRDLGEDQFEDLRHAERQPSESAAARRVSACSCAARSVSLSRAFSSRSPPGLRTRFRLQPLLVVGPALTRRRDHAVVVLGDASAGRSAHGSGRPRHARLASARVPPSVSALQRVLRSRPGVVGFVWSSRSISTSDRLPDLAPRPPDDHQSSALDHVLRGAV